MFFATFFVLFFIIHLDVFLLTKCVVILPIRFDLLFGIFHDTFFALVWSTNLFNKFCRFDSDF
jgi:hypothetical protein